MRELVRQAPGDSDSAGQPLNRAARRRLGDVLAPGRFFVGSPTPKLLAITNPLNPVVLCQDHLHSASGKCIRAEHGDRGWWFGAPAKSDGHAPSIIRVGCELSVDYLWVGRQ
jgi:hypothetical protein